ncbi:uncharacterized protein GIQ15_00242 [Arthroderma uncinatum]|uniref:uncharacterized protein n=1 Tax=Arthroderma uncinatum TaxID=74035 RepID=UPI00144AEEE0|nr:uncharacterized protein GIQ15_00242 [Arthroderma uncinatum]KAF3490725.1 hypothetical protein GIQ15_00242 [Arthroderma uncinatum]
MMLVLVRPASHASGSGSALRDHADRGKHRGFPGRGANDLDRHVTNYLKYRNFTFPGNQDEVPAWGSIPPRKTARDEQREAQVMGNVTWAGRIGRDETSLPSLGWFLTSPPLPSSHYPLILTLNPAA